MGCKEFFFNARALKIAGMLGCGCLVAVGILTFLAIGGVSLNPLNVILAVFYCIFGVLFFCAEARFRFVSVRMNLLAYRLGRAMVYVFFGVVILGLGSVWAYFLGGYLIFVGIWNLIARFAGPKEDEGVDVPTVDASKSGSTAPPPPPPTSVPRAANAV